MDAGNPTDATPLKGEGLAADRRAAGVVPAENGGARPETRRPVAKDAIIYVPGVEQHAPLPGVADRIASAFNINAKSGPARFAIDPGEQLGYGAVQPTEQFDSAVCTVERRESDDADDVRPVADVYSLDYQDNLTRQWKNRNVFLQAILLALTIGVYVLVVIPVAVQKIIPISFRSSKGRMMEVGYKKGFRKGMRWRDIFQVTIVMLLFAALVAYLVLLIIALVQTIDALVSDDPTEVTTSQTWVVIATALGFASPRALKEKFVESVVNYLTMTQYLIFGARRRAVWGQFNELIERVQEKGAYEQIHIVAYSFGCIVAIDALFPPGQKPPPRYEFVKNLVTIGAPVDMTRTFRPRYYDGRRSMDGVPERWTNIYIPGDVLGSNFRNDDDQDTATFNVQTNNAESDPTQLGTPTMNEAHLLAPGAGSSAWQDTVGWIFLLGLSTHHAYWGDRPSDTDAFRVVVNDLYEGHWALS